jgi:hypothetical protein
VTQHRPAAAVALPVASSLLAGCTALGGGGGAPTPTPSGDAEIDILDVRVGDCLVTGGTSKVTRTVPIVDCSLEHDSEAYASVIIDRATFPGADAVSTQAVAECTARFATFVGLAYEESSLDFAYYYPTQSSWERGDREILCLVIDPGAGSVSGSLSGAAR